MVNRGDYLLALGARFSPVTVQPVHAHSHLHTHTWADLAPHTLNLTPRPDHSPRLLVRPRRTNCDSVRRTLGGCGCYPSWEPSRATCVDLHSTRPLFLHSANPAPLTVHNRHARSFSSKRAVPSVLGQPRPCAPRPQTLLLLPPRRPPRRSRPSALTLALAVASIAPSPLRHLCSRLSLFTPAHHCQSPRRRRRRVQEPDDSMRGPSPFC